MINGKQKTLAGNIRRGMLTILCIFLLTGFCRNGLAQPVPAKEIVYNVRDYGAAGDGVLSDTRAINRTIDSAAKNGGGIVYFPAGNYLTGSIHLQSHITLYLANGAVIVAADAARDSTEYDKPEPALNDQFQDFGHSHFHNSLIWGNRLNHVAIIGQGVIYGKGLARSAHEGDYNFDFKANKSIALLLCRNVTIRGITIKHGGWFGILATGTDNLVIDNVKMDTNRDGMDIDACKDVHISNCSINSPLDDAICLKSSFALGYARSTEDVTIINCKVSGYDEGSLLDGTAGPGKMHHFSGGGIKFGTESNGGFKNIAISNCVFSHSKGLALETVDGALLEDVTINNITMRDAVNAPIFIRLGARMRAPDSMKVGECRRILISNIMAYGVASRSGCIISGVPGHDIQDLRLNNIRIVNKGGGTAEERLRKVPEYEKAYPEPHRFGVMPSYGFFIRHVDGLRLDDVQVSFNMDDQRPGFILDHVSDAEVDFAEAETAHGAAPLIIQDCKDLALFRSLGIPEKRYESAGKEIVQ